jgi:hypothetical protein
MSLGCAVRQLDCCGHPEFGLIERDPLRPIMANGQMSVIAKAKYLPHSANLSPAILPLKIEKVAESYRNYPSISSLFQECFVRLPVEQFTYNNIGCSSNN